MARTGRPRTGESERDILRQLAEERRSPQAIAERLERDRKILRMIELGCDYGDISKRYGLCRSSINELRRRYHAKGIGDRFSGSGDIRRSCFACD